jgi:hypothetical protein
MSDIARFEKPRGPQQPDCHVARANRSRQEIIKKLAPSPQLKAASVGGLVESGGYIRLAHLKI